MASDSGDLSILGAVAAVVVLAALAGRELAAASGHAPSRVWSLIVTLALVPLVLLVGWAAAPRVARVFDSAGGVPPLIAPTARDGASEIPHAVEAFDLIPVDQLPEVGWTFTPQSAARVAPDPSSVDRSLALSVAAPDATTEACRRFEPVTRSTASLRAVLRVDAPTEGGRVSVGAFAGGSRIADVTLLGSGGAEYAEGGSMRTTTEVFGLRPGRSYRIAIAIHVSAGTYDWSLRPAGPPLPVLGADGVDLVDQAPRSVDRFCIGIEWDTAETKLVVDDVFVPE